MEQYYLRQLLSTDIFSRPVALQLDNPFRSLITLLTETNLKRSNLDLAGLTNSLNEVLESSMELARLGPILVKYSLNPLAISCVEVILKPSTDCSSENHQEKQFLRIEKLFRYLVRAEIQKQKPPLG